jgi:hypothetical protein
MTDKQKNIALLLGFLILFILAYFFSIKKTVDLKKSLSILEQEQELLANASSRIFNLQQENRYLDSILKQKELSVENSFQQTLLQKINNFSKTVSTEIIAFDEPHSFISNDTKIETYTIEIKANYNNLLKLVNYLEQQQLGKIVSLNLEKKKNYRRNREELTVKISIQKLSKEKD